MSFELSPIFYVFMRKENNLAGGYLSIIKYNSHRTSIILTSYFHYINAYTFAKTFINLLIIYNKVCENMFHIVTTSESRNF